MVIYADILFLINFITDMLCLFISGRVMNLKIRKIRMCLASAVGGIYGVLSEITELYEPFCAVSISVIMVLVCFDIKSVLSFVKTLVLMYCTGMLLGGIMSLMQNFVYSNRHLKLFSDGMDFRLFSVMFAAIFLFVTFVSGIFGAHIHRKSASFIIVSGQKEKRVELLLDSGNLLKDPYNGKAVVIVKAEILDTLLGKDGIHRSIFEMSEEKAAEAKVHFISAETVGGHTLLPVIGSLKIYACGKSGKNRELFACVASYETENGSYMGFDGVMPYMLEGSF